MIKLCDDKRYQCRNSRIMLSKYDMTLVQKCHINQMYVNLKIVSD